MVSKGLPKCYLGSECDVALAAALHRKTRADAALGVTVPERLDCRTARRRITTSRSQAIMEEQRR